MESAPSSSRAGPIPKEAHKRDSAATRQRILDAARAAFAEHGFTGARVESIARASRANVQMIYRYFGNKEDLYLAALADTYARVRGHEQQLDLPAHAPREGIRRLVEFTFDYLNDNPEFVAIIRNENVLGGQFARRVLAVSESTRSLLGAIDDLLRRGRHSGEFTAPVDARHLYVAILSLCMLHQTQRSTLSVMLEVDLGASDWLADHRRIAVDVILSYLTAPRR